MTWTPEEIEMFRSETFGVSRWESSFCLCSVVAMSERTRVIPCSFDHVVWAWRVGVPVVQVKQKIREAAMPRPGYREVLDGYLRWCNGMALTFGAQPGSYQHGKASREWHIKEWKEGIRQGLFLAEEFVGSLGCDERNFESIFGRPIDQNILQQFSHAGTPA